jgi:hypothetical protein
VKTNRSTLRDRCAKAIAGTKQHLASEPSVPLEGTSYTPAAVEARFQSAIDAADATVTARGVFRDAVKAEAAQRAGILLFLTALKAYVVLKFGQDAAATQADFGFVPRKKPVRTADAKAMAAAKTRATRAARKTMGSVQKRDVKGTVTAVTITADGATATDGSTQPAGGAAAQPAATAAGSGGAAAAPATPSGTPVTAAPRQ